jgi:acetyl esterase/lipase
MDVYAPRAAGPWPVVVLLAGGPKAPGGQGYVTRAARPIAERGAVVMAADWRQAAEHGGGWRSSFRDVACAVGVARRTAGRYGGRDDRVVLVGHSLGGWAAAVVALSPEPFTPGGGQCARTAGSLRPDGLVTLAGAVDEVTNQGLGPAYLTAFFHGTQAQRPQAWAAADPFSLVRAHHAGSSSVEVTVVRGGRDTVVTRSAGPALHRALRRAGYRSRLVDVPSADHNGLLAAPKAVAAVTAALR